MDIRTFIQKNNTILSTAIFTIAVAWFIRKTAKKPDKFETLGSKAIPTPKGDYFYLGHFPLLGKNPGFKVTEWHKELGPIFRIKAGVQDWIFIGEPEAAHEIFVTNGAWTSGRPYITYLTGIHGEGGRGVAFIDNDATWKNTRTACLNMLSSKSIDSLYDVIDRENEYGINVLINETLNNQNINPLPYVHLSSLNIILAIVFGTRANLTIQDPIYKRVMHMIQVHFSLASTVNDIGSYFPILSFLDIIFRRKKKMRDFVENESRPLFRELIEMARQSDRPSLIKRLDEVKASMNIDELNMIVIAKELLLGGADTVSGSLGFILAVLCHHPEWQTLMSNEIGLFYKAHSRMPMFTERKELPVTLAVIKEAIRYRPAVYLGVPHKATKDIVYKDYVIPKGSSLISNAHTTNSDPRFFDEPEKFKPERFFGDTRSLYASSNGKIQNREVFSFGWGRRLCPGIYMAESEIFNWICQLLLKCSIEPALSSTGENIYPDLDNVVDHGSTTEPYPYQIRLIQRKK